MYIVDNRKLAEMQGVLITGKDAAAASRVLTEIQQIPHESTRIGMLDYAATHCGLSEVALKAFDQLTEALESYPPDVKAGQVEDMYFSGTKISEVSDRAVDFTLNLVENGELDPGDLPTRNFLNFVVQQKPAPMHDRASKLLAR